MSFIWNATPAYKGNQQQPASTGLLAGLGGVFGSVTPDYKSVGNASAQASASSSSWWPVFSAAPVYKTAPSSVAASSAPSTASPDDGGDGSDPVCVCDEATTEVVVVG